MKIMCIKFIIFMFIVVIIDAHHHIVAHSIHVDRHVIPDIRDQDLVHDHMNIVS